MFAPLKQELLRVRLRHAAQRFADHGWAVTPGGYFNGVRMACDRPDCWASSCHPLLIHWDAEASVRPARLNQWWRDQPHAVLLPTGLLFDAIEVPALLGAAVRQHTGPVGITPTGRWMFLVQAGATLRPELDHRIDVVQHASGSWIPAPPTVLPEGSVRWKISPEQAGWRLPNAEATQRALVHALIALDAAALELPARRRLIHPSTLEHRLVG